MSNGRKPFSILKWINYKDGSMAKLEEKLGYVANPKSSPEKFRKGYFLDPLFPMEGLATIHRRYVPVGKRNFKHGLFSFGVPDISPEFAFAVSQELMKYYSKKYPILLCVHTNFPKRIHTHFILDTCSVVDGKKFAQAPAEFEAYRQYFNTIMRKNGLPLLKNTNLEPEPVTEEINSYIHDEFYPQNQDFRVMPSVWGGAQIYQPIEIRQPQPIMQQPSVRLDCKINCDVDAIIKNIIVGMTELTLLTKNWRNKNDKEINECD